MANAKQSHTQAASAAPVNDSPESIALAQSPGDRACRYALSADTIFCAYATKAGGDLGWGLHWIAENASTVALTAIESGDIESIEMASLRYAQAIAIVQTICQGTDEELLVAAVSMMEATKNMIDAESERLIEARTKGGQS